MIFTLSVAGCSKREPEATEGALSRLLEVKRSSIHLNAVSFDDKGWIAVGDFGAIAASENGIDFATVYADPERRSLRAVAQAGKGRAVAVGDRGVVLATENGRDWKSVSGLDTNEDLKSVAYSTDGLWAIVGANGTVIYSSAWNVWHLRPTPERSDLNVIAFDGKRLVAVGAEHSSDGYVEISRATVLQSEDNASPTRSVINQGDLSAIAAGPGGWAAVGKRGSIVTRRGGGDVVAWAGSTTFTTNQAGRFPSYKKGMVEDDFLAVAAASQPGNIVAVGSNGVIADTSDGKNWRVRRARAKLPLLSVAWGPAGRWVAVGERGSIITAENLRDINEYSTDAGRLIAIDYRGSRWVAVGESGVVVTSADAKSWNVSDGFAKDGEIRSLQFYKGNWVAAGSDGIVGSLPGGQLGAKSLGSKPANPSFNVLESDERLAVAAGENGSIRVSRNGRDWTPPSAVPRDLDIRLGSFFALAQHRGRWVAVGGKEAIEIEGPDDPKLAEIREGEDNFRKRLEALKAPKSLILVSPDGDIWKRVDLDTASTLRSVAHDDRGMFVAVGDLGLILTSSDGKYWRPEQSPTSSNLGAVAYGNGKWIAAGKSGSLVSSIDGVDWQLVKGIADVNLNAIANDGHRWAVVGAGGAVFSSEDGVRWRRGRNEVSEDLLAAAYGSGRWVAVGGGGSIVTSENGTNWYSIRSPTDATLGAVASGPGGWAVAGQSGAWLFLQATTELPIIRNVDIEFRALGSDHVVVELDPRSSQCGDAQLEFLGQSNAAFAAEGGVPLQTVQSKRQIQLASAAKATVGMDVDLARQLNLKPSEAFWYSVQLRCNAGLVTYPRAAEAASMTFRPWYLGIPPWSLFLIAWYVIVAVFLLFLYIFYPVGILRLRFTIKRLIPFETKKIPIVGTEVGDLLGAFSLWTVPLLSERRRVLRGWVETSAERWTDLGFRTLDLVRLRSGYVPLPCTLGDFHAGETIDKPDPTLLFRCFSANTPFLEIVGPDGAGKTMLAVQIARWALEQADPAICQRRLPVVIEEDILEKDGVLPVVLRKLKAVFGEHVDDKLATTLLKHGFVLLIFDSASERTAETFSYIERLQGRVEASAVIVTTRTPAQYEGKQVLRLYPLPLTSTSLMALISTLLRDLDHNKTVTSPEERFQLASQITSASARGEMPGTSEQFLTPLAVRLFVERSIGLRQEGRSE